MRFYPLTCDESFVYLPGVRMSLSTGVWEPCDQLSWLLDLVNSKSFFFPDLHRRGGLFVLETATHRGVAMGKSLRVRPDGSIEWEKPVLSGDSSLPVVMLADGSLYVRGAWIRPDGSVIYPDQLSASLTSLIPSPSEIGGVIFADPDRETAICHYNYQLLVFRKAENVLSIPFDQGFLVFPDGLWMVSWENQLIWGVEDETLSQKDFDSLGLISVHRITGSLRPAGWLILLEGENRNADPTALIILLNPRGEMEGVHLGVCQVSEIQDVLTHRLLLPVEESKNPFCTVLPFFGTTSPIYAPGLKVERQIEAEGRCFSWIAGTIRGCLVIIPDGEAIPAYEVAFGNEGVLLQTGPKFQMLFIPDYEPSRARRLYLPCRLVGKIWEQDGDLFVECIYPKQQRFILRRGMLVPAD